MPAVVVKLVNIDDVVSLRRTGTKSFDVFLNNSLTKYHGLIFHPGSGTELIGYSKQSPESGYTVWPTIQLVAAREKSHKCLLKFSALGQKKFKYTLQAS